MVNIEDILNNKEIDLITKTELNLLDPDQLNRNGGLPYGNGFYTYLKSSESIEHIKKNSEMFETPIKIYNYRLSDDYLRSGKPKILTFKGPTMEWFNYIYGNFVGTPIDTSKYDIIIGPVFNDKYKFDFFLKKFTYLKYNLERYTKMGLNLINVVIKTEEAAENLKYLGCDKYEW